MMALSGLLFRCKINEISIGYGKILFRIPFLGFPIKIKVLPIGGFVQFACSETQENPLKSGEFLFEQLSLLVRLVIILSGCLFLLVIAYFIGGGEALYSGFLIWDQYFQGALSPLHDAQTLITQIASFVQSTEALVLLAFICAKFAALNLMPLGVLNGGAFIGVLLDATGNRKFGEYFQISTLIVLLLASCSWLVALCLWVL